MPYKVNAVVHSDFNAVQPGTIIVVETLTRMHEVVDWFRDKRPEISVRFVTAGRHVDERYEALELFRKSKIDVLLMTHHMFAGGGWRLNRDCTAVLDEHAAARDERRVLHFMAAAQRFAESHNYLEPVIRVDLDKQTTFREIASRLIFAARFDLQQLRHKDLTTEEQCWERVDRVNQTYANLTNTLHELGNLYDYDSAYTFTNCFRDENAEFRELTDLARTMIMLAQGSLLHLHMLSVQQAMMPALHPDLKRSIKVEVKAATDDE